MKPTLFPYSYLSDSESAVLTMLFGSLKIYQPAASEVPDTLKRMTREGQLEICTPVRGAQDRIAKRLAEYRQWMALHGPTQKSILRLQSEIIPVIQDTAPSRIRSQIREQIRGSRNPDASDPLLWARSFLMLAQQLDSDQQEYRLGLQDLARMEQTLLAQLHSRDADAAGSAVGRAIPEGHDSRDYLIPERLAAWALLMDQDPQPPVVLVTPNRNVITHLTAWLPGVEIVPNFDNAPIPVDSHTDKPTTSSRFLVYLKKLATDPDAVSGHNAIPMIGTGDPPGPQMRLSLYRIPDFSPRYFLKPDTLDPSPVPPRDRPMIVAQVSREPDTA
jgi:hypothetical protein